MKILILGLNYAPEMIGVAVYTTGLAEALARRGHDVRAVVGKPYYPAWTVPMEYRGSWMRHSVEGGVDLTRVAHYVPHNPTGPRRILHHASFALSSLIPTLVLARKQRPDLVLTVAPSLLATPVAWLAAFMAGARSWLHIQDFEIEAAIAVGLVGKKGVAARLATGLEGTLLGLFDRTSTISPAMCRKLVEKGIAPERVIEFRNWAEIDQVKPLTRDSRYRSAWNITTPHVALYSGNIANKQGIDIIVAAARRLKHRDDLTFVVCGDGPNRANLEAQAVDLSNIRFYGLQPKEQLGELLGLASVHLMPQLAGAADLVLPSKLANMLASGRPVVTTAASGTWLVQEVEGCGIVVPPGDEAAFAAAIENLLQNNDLRSLCGQRARLRAEERWAYEAVIAGLETELLKLVQKP